MNFTPPGSNDIPGILAWARRLVDEINRFIPSAAELPTFADDAAAASGRVKVGEEYFTPDGFRKRRVA